MRTEGKDIQLILGVEHIYDDIGKLLTLWEEMQRSSGEVINSPSPHMFGFAETTILFAVIYEKPKKAENAEQSVPEAQVEFDTGTWSSAGDPWIDELLDGDKAAPPTDLDEDELNFLGEGSSDYNGAENQFATTPTDLRYTTSQNYTCRPSTSAIGVVYVTTSLMSNVTAGEVNLGIVLHPDARGRGYARQTLELVLSWVFDEMRFHRVQASLVDSPQKDKAMTLFTQMGFNHEGTRRRSVFCPEDCCWKDVTYFSMLDTDYLNRAYIKPAPKSLWDELFLRHQREREELLRWEERNSRVMKRTGSMETVRLGKGIADLPSSDTDDDFMSASESVIASRRSSVSTSSSSSSGRSFTNIQNPFVSSSSTPFLWNNFSPPHGSQSFSPSPSPAPSSSSSRSLISFGSFGRNSEPPLSPTSDVSQWDLVETSSVSTHTSLDSYSDIE